MDRRLVSLNSKTRNVKGTIMKQKTLISLLQNLCEEKNLSYDGTPPIEVSPGVWRFLAVERSEQCMRHGYCRQLSHFATMSGDTMKLC